MRGTHACACAFCERASPVLELLRTLMRSSSGRVPAYRHPKDSILVSVCRHLPGWEVRVRGSCMRLLGEPAKFISRRTVVDRQIFGYSMAWTWMMSAFTAHEGHHVNEWGNGYCLSTENSVMRVSEVIQRRSNEGRISEHRKVDHVNSAGKTKWVP